MQLKGTCFSSLLTLHHGRLLPPGAGHHLKRLRGGGAGLQAAAAGAPVLEDEQPHQVDGQAQRPHDEHQRGAVDGLGPGQAQHRLHQDGEAEGGEEDGVAQRPHRLGAAVAVGGGGAPAGAAGDAAGGDAHAQRDEVREHVERVRHQRDGVAQVAGDQLGHEEAGGQHQHEDQAAGLARVAPHPGGWPRTRSEGGRRALSQRRAPLPASPALRPAPGRASAPSLYAAAPGSPPPPRQRVAPAQPGEALPAPRPPWLACRDQGFVLGKTIACFQTLVAGRGVRDAGHNPPGKRGCWLTGLVFSCSMVTGYMMWRCSRWHPRLWISVSTVLAHFCSPTEMGCSAAGRH
ncbi:uncharacterized protein [Lepidochelys kempii]|uniref:uncharacterized protein isoform X2 n=1 Tax=Lepidochelys kempii TaxID=8472 RepID=UPI003C702C23